MNGIDLIAAERARQKLERRDGGEGYDADHDAGHEDELAAAAACYALPAEDRKLTGDVGVGIDVAVDLVAAVWPWAQHYWKPVPGDRVRELTKAGALIAAALDALLPESEEAQA